MGSVSVFVSRCGVFAATMALVACGGDGPTTPTNGTNTITVVSNSGSQSFSPNPASLGGQTATWRNSHTEIHRMVANDGSFDTGEIAPGATSRTVQLPAAGANYHCTLHPTMIGSIGGSGGAPPPPCEDAAYC